MATKSSTSSSKKTPKKKKCNCPICDKVITDQDGQRKGHDAVFCDGVCQEWLHRVCAGLPKKVFLEIKDSVEPSYCLNCTNRRQEKEIAALNSKIGLLLSKLTELESSTSPSNSPAPEASNQLSYAQAALLGPFVSPT